MQTDLLKRLENTLGDCVIGPIRTLKTGDLADVLYDAHEEIERLRAREARLRALLKETLAVMPICPPEFEHIVGAKARYELVILEARAALGEEKKG